MLDQMLNSFCIIKLFKENKLWIITPLFKVVTVALFNYISQGFVIVMEKGVCFFLFFIDFL